MQSDHENPLMRTSTMRFSDEDIAVSITFETEDGSKVIVKSVDVETPYSKDENNRRLERMRREFRGMKRIHYYWADFMAEIKLMFRSDD